jgi:hypothetical protein
MTAKAHDPLLAKGGLDLLELTLNRPARAGIGSIRKSASAEWLALVVAPL